MILKALYDLAQNDSLVEDPDFEVRPVARLIRIGEGGRYLGMTGTHYEVEVFAGKKKVKQRRAKAIRVPKRLPGKSGKNPPAELLADNAKFVLGASTNDKIVPKADGLAAQARFLALVREGLERTGDEGLDALQEFLVAVREDRVSVVLGDDVRSNDVFAFVYEPDGERLISDRPKVVEWIRARRQAQAAGAERRGRCLVTGKVSGLAPKHDKIKNLPGGNAAGTALVSFNQKAFESYGWGEADNATISQEAAEACAIALNRLLSPAFPDPANPDETLPRRNLRLGGDTAVCYWTSSSSATEFLNCLGGLLDGNEESVPELYRSFWRGRMAPVPAEGRFFGLTISGAQGRAVVRSWVEATIPTVAQSLAEYFRDLDCARLAVRTGGGATGALSVAVLLQSLSAQGKSENTPPHLAAALMEAALQGVAFPFVFLQRAIERTRAEIGGVSDWAVRQRQDARAALIKGFLNRWRRLHSETSRWKEVQKEMDPTNESPGYLLGRLMAVLERLQQCAIGDVNASIVDRYFSGASGAPRLVFTRLLKNAMHHERKAQDESKSAGLAIWLSRMKDEVLSRFPAGDGGIPARLTLEEQGLFILGYHQMRHWLWLSQEDRLRWAQDREDLPAVYAQEKRKSGNGEAMEGEK